MKAVLSGRAGVAVLAQPPGLVALGPEGKTDQPLEHVARLLAEAGDVEWADVTDRHELAERLAVAMTREEALDLILALLDPELPATVRSDAGHELEERLSNPRIAASLEDILLARPLPEDSDLAGARSCLPTAATRSGAFLDLVDGLQPSVSAVARAWTTVATKHLASAAEVGLAEAAFMDLGVLSDLARAHNRRTLHVDRLRLDGRAARISGIHVLLEGLVAALEFQHIARTGSTITIGSGSVAGRHGHVAEAASNDLMTERFSAGRGPRSTHDVEDIASRLGNRRGQLESLRVTLEAEAQQLEASMVGIREALARCGQERPGGREHFDPKGTGPARLETLMQMVAEQEARMEELRAQLLRMPIEYTRVAETHESVTEEHRKVSVLLDELMRRLTQAKAMHPRTG